MERNKLIVLFVTFLFLFLCFMCNSFAALTQQFTATDEATLNATIWNDEFDNIYDNPNDYAEGMSLSAATIDALSGNLTGGGTVTGTITGNILSSTNAITPSNEPTSCSGITYLPNWTVVTNGDSPYSVSNGDNLLIDVTDGQVELDLPTPTGDGDFFRIVDIHDLFATNNLLIDPQGYYLYASTSTLTVDFPLSTVFIYINADGGAPGWIPVNYGYTTQFKDNW